MSRKTNVETIRNIALELCKREGKKRQVDIAQMFEVVVNVADLIYESTHEPRFEGSVANTLYYVGRERSLKKQELPNCRCMPLKRKK